MHEIFAILVLFISYKSFIIKRDIEVDILTVYNLTPIWLQNIICSIKGIKLQYTRYSSDFKKLLYNFENREKWSYEQICEFRNQKLNELIKHAYETVPYYKECFKNIGAIPDDIKTIEDLIILPLLNKTIVNANLEKFISSKAKQYHPIHKHTSGTTGTGFKFLGSLLSDQAQWATFWRQRYQLGITFDTWCAHFGGQQVVPASQKKPPFWRIEYPGKRVYFSAYHENEDNLKYYYEKIKNSNIEWIHGFPSLISLLANYMNNNNLTFSKIKYVTTGAENLLMHQIETMTKAFGVRPVQCYGQAENVAIFSQRTDGRIFVDEDFSAVEFLKNDKGAYNIVGTNLWNYVMPLIRWETNDTVSLSKNINNTWREILSIDGRQEDYITLPDGTKIGRLDYAFKDTINIKEAQLYQKSDYSLTVYIVGSPMYCKEDVKIVSNVLNNSFNMKIPITYEYVDKIPHTSNGKLRFVISEIV